MLDAVKENATIHGANGPGYTVLEAECEEALQQAAEQACYRYALAVLERLMERGDIGADRLRIEIAEVRQLIAGSA